MTPSQAAADAPVRHPLVLLAGMLGDETVWDDVAERLGDAALPWPARIDLDDTVTAMAASVLAVAPRRFTLVGHSLGGIVALEVLRQAPQRIERLALLATSGRPPSDAQQAAWKRWGERVEAGEFAAVAAELGCATLGAPVRDDDALVERNTAMAWSVGPDGFVRQLAAQATRPDARERLASFARPVAVLSGELDDVSPPDLQRELAASCPSAELVSVPGAGHMLPLEAPDAVAAALRALLARPSS
ncbi:MAG: alpha/beta fold hydrolase [Jatrophihabitans sp.]|uniref:alpha/beta fold hydrolase n=1 Tax=Jatrophihabitans sp. TaxID=1932789 RepID=UPI003F7FFD3B